MREGLILSGEGVAAMAESGLTTGAKTQHSDRGSGDDSDSSESLGLLAQLQETWVWLERELWATNFGAPAIVRALRSTAQLIALTAKGFQNDNLLLRASALTYVTALSIIPMLGVVIGVLGLVGGDDTVVNFAIKQLTTVAPDVRETVRDYATRLDFSNLGKIGGTILFGTAIFALRHLEGTLNEIWGVPGNRNWARRFADYLAIMVVAPITIGVAVSLATTLQSEPAMARLLDQPAFARVYGLGLTQVPLVALFVGFTFLYWFFPNTKVRIRSAAFGGLVAAVLFSAARGIYVDFQIGATTYQAVFGALSAIPLILVWLYVCWAVVLLGAEVAFATQNLPYARREMRSGETSPAQEEAIAVELAVEIVRRFGAQETPPVTEWLADSLDAPVRLVRQLVDDLERADLVRGVLLRDDKERGYVPARPVRNLTVGDVLRAVRGEVDWGSEARAESNEPVAQLLGRLRSAWSEVADQTSLETLSRMQEETTSAGHA
jgi:membrane protein